MIDLAFGESAAGALKLAKSMKRGEIMRGASAVFGGTGTERRGAAKPRAWSGETMDGGPEDVALLALMLDKGDLSDLDGGMEARRGLLDELYGDFPGVPEEMWAMNLRTLERLHEAAAASEPVRVWVFGSDPADLCGLYFVCHLMRDSAAPLSVVRVPAETEEDGVVARYGGMGDFPAEALGAIARREEPLSGPRREAYGRLWHALASENARLRAAVNGNVASVPEDFYDFALRANVPDGVFRSALLIGKALLSVYGVGDRWLYLRMLRMIRAEELIEVAPPDGDFPYSAVLKRGGR